MTDPGNPHQSGGPQPSPGPELPLGQYTTPGPQPSAVEPLAVVPAGLGAPLPGNPPPGQWAGPPPRPPALPVEPREYHQFWRAPAYRWWKGLVGLVLVGLLWGMAITVVSLVALVIDAATGAIDMEKLTTGITPPMTPGLFIATNLGIALAIPATLLIQRALIGQKGGWLSSVDGVLRWRWLGRLMLVLLPLYAVATAIEWAFGLPEDFGVGPNTAITIIGILTTTAFQAAGEEYLCRGFITRAVGSWIKSPAVSLLVAWLASATVFTLLHGAGDPWLNIMYFTIATLLSYVTWRTGGLEAAIAIHIVHNLAAEAAMPFIDYSDMMERGAGTAGPEVGIYLLVDVLAVVAIEIMVRRRRPALSRSAAPMLNAWVPVPPAPMAGASIPGAYLDRPAGPPSGQPMPPYTGQPMPPQPGPSVGGMVHNPWMQQPPQGPPAQGHAPGVVPRTSASAGTPQSGQPQYGPPPGQSAQGPGEQPRRDTDAAAPEEGPQQTGQSSDSAGPDA